MGLVLKGLGTTAFDGEAAFKPDSVSGAYQKPTGSVPGQPSRAAGGGGRLLHLFQPREDRGPADLRLSSYFQSPLSCCGGREGAIPAGTVAGLLRGALLCSVLGGELPCCGACWGLPGKSKERQSKRWQQMRSLTRSPVATNGQPRQENVTTVSRPVLLAQPLSRCWCPSWSPLVIHLLDGPICRHCNRIGSSRGSHSPWGIREALAGSHAEV